MPQHTSAPGCSLTCPAPASGRNGYGRNGYVGGAGHGHRLRFRFGHQTYRLRLRGVHEACTASRAGFWRLPAATGSGPGACGGLTPPGEQPAPIQPDQHAHLQVVPHLQSIPRPRVSLRSPPRSAGYGASRTFYQGGQRREAAMNFKPAQSVSGDVHGLLGLFIDRESCTGHQH
jgi:hypothetical protein